MAQIQYIPITNVRFDNSGNIIMKITNTQSSISRPALSSSDDDDVSGTTWSAGKTIFELQKTAFDAIKAALQANSTDEPLSLSIYYKAIQSIVDYNAYSRGFANQPNQPRYYQIVFYNTYNGNVDYRQYENLIKSRDFIKAKMDYINGAPGSLSHEQSIQSLNGVYTNTLVAIAAVSLLYMAFISL
jgi:hypothetical protein